MFDILRLSETMGLGMGAMREEAEDLKHKDDVTYWFNIVKKMPKLSKEEEKILITRAQDGDLEARNRLIECNLRLVIHFAKRYRSCCNGNKVSFADLISMGNMGLFAAIENFDLTRGLKFSTYAMYWIVQSIKRTTSQEQDLIRLPVHIHETMIKYKKIIHEKPELIDELDDDDWAEELNKDSSFVLSKQVTQEVRRYVAVSGVVVNSIHPTGTDDNDMDMETRDKELSVENKGIEQLDFNDLLSRLNLVEKNVIGHLFGVVGYPKLCVDGLKDKYGLSIPEIREIKDKALSKLRHLLVDVERLCDREETDAERQCGFF